MANKRDPYETKVISTGFFNKKKLTKLVDAGWELLSTSQHGMGGTQEHTLRRPNPKYKAKK